VTTSYPRAGLAVPLQPKRPTTMAFEAATPVPDLQQMRQQVLSSIYSSGGRQNQVDSGVSPASNHRPASLPPPDPVQTPAEQRYPNGYLVSPPSSLPARAWAHPEGSTVSRATQQRPGEADIRVAELDAARIAAQTIQCRQAETIHRLAAQLGRAERLERSRERKRRSARVQSTPRRKKSTPSRRDADEFDEDLSIEDEGEEWASRVDRSDSKVRKSSLSASRRPRETPRPTSSASKRQAHGSGFGVKAVSWPSEEQPRPRSRTTSARKLNSADDNDFEKVRRKVLALNSRASLVDENASLRADNARAKEEAQHFQSFIADIRRSFSSLLADQDEMRSLIQSLQPRNESRGTAVKPDATRRASAEQPEARVNNLETPRKQGYASHFQSPTDIRFSGFDTPTPCRAGPEVDGEDGRNERLHAAIGPETSPSMERELRAELRTVLEENAALSERLVELEDEMDLRLAQGSLHLQAQQASRNPGTVAVDASALDNLRTEVMVLSSVADCMHFDAIDATGMQTQATLTILAGDTAQLLAPTNCPSFADKAFADKVAVQDLASEVAQIRKTIALKYGEWLSVVRFSGMDKTLASGRPLKRGEMTTDRFDCDISDDSGTLKGSDSDSQNFSKPQPGCGTADAS
jgi:hypothetical protein